MQFFSPYDIFKQPILFFRNISKIKFYRFNPVDFFFSFEKKSGKGLLMFSFSLSHKKALRIISAWRNCKKTTNAKPAAHYTQCLPTLKKTEHHQPFDFIYLFAQAYTPCRLTVGSFLNNMQKNPLAICLSIFYIFFKNVRFCVVKTELDFL